MEEKGWTYCYVTRSETYKRYRSEMESVFGKEHTFFLDTGGDWERFIKEVAENCGDSP